MNVILIAATSLDGYIARHPLEHIDFNSPADKAWFRERTRQAGAVIMGRNTFETFGQHPLPERLNVVVTHQPASEQADPAGTSDLQFTNQSPAQILAELERRGHHEAAVIGGSQINALFLQAGLINELFVTITPHLFGSGVPLFADAPEIKLELIDSRPLGPGELLLHYRVAS
ncbi:MAG TPA: dihydrofolate reductase family protein [Candidatus Saccharimonadales bacterium]|nr:dihydrofolate reductase family protein [Candidatus Saccharimonadales bacterium]